MEGAEKIDKKANVSALVYSNMMSALVYSNVSALVYSSVSALVYSIVFTAYSNFSVLVYSNVSALVYSKTMILLYCLSCLCNVEPCIYAVDTRLKLVLTSKTVPKFASQQYFL